MTSYLTLSTLAAVLGEPMKCERRVPVQVVDERGAIRWAVTANAEELRTLQVVHEVMRPKLDEVDGQLTGVLAERRKTQVYIEVLKHFDKASAQLYERVFAARGMVPAVGKPMKEEPGLWLVCAPPKGV